MEDRIEVSISVAMTTFNGGAYLEEQLDSILRQSVQVSEIVVCDDGSSDQTLNILERYSKLANLRYFVNEQSLGFVRNFEKSISLCTGEYIFLADQDDVWNTEKVAVLLDNVGNSLLIHSDCDLIDGRGEVLVRRFKGEIKSHSRPEDFLFANVVTGCTAMVHRDLLQYALPFPDGISYHDWYLAIHASYLGRLTYVGRSLTGYRQHSNQDTGAREKNREGILRHFLMRLKGEEYRDILAAKRQLTNLKATLGDFTSDSDFTGRRLRVIGVLEQYIGSFFHFSYGAYYSNEFRVPDKPKLVRLLYQLKHSIG